MISSGPARHYECKEVRAVSNEFQAVTARQRIIPQQSDRSLSLSKTMRLNLSQARLGKTTRVAEGVFVIKTMVGIGDGGGHLTHDGLRQRFLLNLQDGREEEILQVFCPPRDSLTTGLMLIGGQPHQL